MGKDRLQLLVVVLTTSSSSFFFRVGKTSLISRFVEGKFSTRYHSTYHTSKEVRVDKRKIMLQIWDTGSLT